MKLRAALFFTMTLLIPLNLWAQSGDLGSVRRNVATIIFCGIGGAVLGMSTLSFYGEPQEHVSNITSGFALGLIGGTVFVTAKSMRENASNVSYGPQAWGSVPVLWQTSWTF